MYAALLLVYVPQDKARATAAEVPKGQDPDSELVTNSYKFGGKSPSQGAWRGTATSLELADELSEEQRLSDPIRADAPPARLPDVIVFRASPQWQMPSHSTSVTRRTPVSCCRTPPATTPIACPIGAPESPQCGYCISPVGLRVPLRPCDTESI